MGLDLSPLNAKSLSDLEFVLNNTPRSILGLKTLQELFSRPQIDHIAGVALQS
jgi:hypothetical protein